MDEQIVVFEAFDARTEVKLLQNQLKIESQLKSLKDLQKYLVLSEDNSWLLDDKLHSLVLTLIRSELEEIRVRILRLLALASLQETFINFLNLDRQERVVMKQALNFKSLTLNEQKALAMLICNLFKHPRNSCYALYFSQWPSGDPGLNCNAQIVVNLAKECLQSQNPSLMHCGAGIFYNISQKHVLVLEKPLSENPDLFDGFDQANLDSEKISQQDFCDKKGSVVALKAYDEIVIDICGTAWEILTETKDLQAEVLTCLLATLSNFVHMLDFAGSEMAQELEIIREKNGLSQSNLRLLNELLAKTAP